MQDDIDYVGMAIAEDAAERAAAAVKTLEAKGYTYGGAQLWRPPLGPKPDFNLLDQAHARCEALQQLLNDRDQKLDALEGKLRADIDNLEAEKFALEDQVEGLQELMAQHGQGEPVARVEVGADRNACMTITNSDWLRSLKDKASHQVVPLYTHADPSEVERLRADLASVKADRDAYGQNAIDLRAQLAEAHALLREARKFCNWPRHPLPEKIDAALSASAEPNQCDGCQAGIPLVNGSHRMGKPDGYPDTMSCQAGKYASAPVERDERSEFEREERYVVIKISKMHPHPIFRARHLAELKRFYGDAMVDCVVVESDWPEYEPTWSAIEARAALERKPS